ncbi:MAG: hypothetical protein KDJ15_04870, partial [Alphaproteobacteria bacterium]|nr:hypothetical protein [Alphaproteobacteria bacterium]
MHKQLFHFGRHTVLILLETLAVLILLCSLAGGALLWRLTTGPLDVSFAREHIARALSDPTTGHTVTADGVLLAWPDLKGPLILTLEKLAIARDDRPVLQIDRVDLGLAGPPLFLGQVEPSDIILTQPVLRLIRDPNGAIRLGMEGEQLPPGAVEDSPDSQGPLMRIVRRLAQDRGTIDKRSPLDHLQSLEIKDARMTVEDQVLNTTWSLPDLDVLFARNPGGLLMTAALSLPGGDNNAAEIRADVLYVRDRDDFTARLHLQDFDPHILSSKIPTLAWMEDQRIVLNGDVSATVDADMKLTKLDVALFSGAGALSLPGLYEAPLAIEETSLEAAYDAETEKLAIESLNVTLQDVTLTLAGEGKVAPDDIRFPMTIAVKDLPQAKIVSLWPDSLRGIPVEDWLTRRLSGGRFTEATLRFDLAVTKEPG